jgi:hypothetical protein
MSDTEERGFPQQFVVRCLVHQLGAQVVLEGELYILLLLHFSAAAFTPFHRASVTEGTAQVGD